MDTQVKLLLLEDSPSDAALIQKLLQRSGIRFSAKVASDEEEFLAALEENDFDAVLADNALPQYSSLEALKLLKEKNPFVAFILVTGTVSEEFAVNILQLGADDYILKTNLVRLPSAISKAVENRMMQKEKQYAEKEMKELNEQLRSLTAHLQHVREEEQARIAREIHDELGQLLTAIKMDISSANRKITEAPDEAKIYLAQSLKMVDDTVKTVRRIASELRPGILEDFGLIAALEWQSQEFEKRNDILCNFTCPIPKLTIEKNISIGLYRIYQEALTNVARHSGANIVTSAFTREGDNLVLSISDNGNGFDPLEIKSKKTLGLLGMKERALIMKGELVTQSIPGTGTTITVTIPLPALLPEQQVLSSQEVS